MKYIKEYNSFINENMGNNNRQFRYLDLEPLEFGLKISLNEDGLKRVEEDDDLTEQNFYEYFDDIQANTEYIFFNDMGEAGFGLTEAPGITYGYYYNDKGDLTDEDEIIKDEDEIEEDIIIKHSEDSEVYYFEPYMIKDFTAELKEKGYVIFLQVPKHNE